MFSPRFLAVLLIYQLLVAFIFQTAVGDIVGIKDKFGNLETFREGLVKTANFL